MSKHRAAVSASVIGLVCIGLVAGIFLLANQMARAQSDAPEASSPNLPPPAPPDTLMKFGQLYPPDEGALSFEELSADEKAASDRMAEWAEADHGASVHDRWRQASREGARLSRLKEAEYDSGLAGLAGLGED